MCNMTSSNSLSLIWDTEDEIHSLTEEFTDAYVSGNESLQRKVIKKTLRSQSLLLRLNRKLISNAML